MAILPNIDWTQPDISPARDQHSGSPIVGEPTAKAEPYTLINAVVSLIFINSAPSAINKGKLSVSDSNLTIPKTTSLNLAEITICLKISGFSVETIIWPRPNNPCILPASYKRIAASLSRANKDILDICKAPRWV